ncbi:hypothetical protein [Nonomuraea cavernae]|uniref:Uncharacterized protein n=1 Tax=Nonomuraea cavernae TaxID=2045107 RepID=A0A917Z593_9ACTN|nr:hypothetical protein [Nonomuraea cavernae]MCA2186975.1 hypothetical protein [Nonomuraea cavernae]GGO75131.1 hypothetical protein GCM10012289_49450 [Nonomuraea cavernae]
MGLITAVTWAFTALVGIYPLYLWLAGGGPRRQAAKVTRFPVTLLFSHPVLAVAALGCWIGHLVTGDRVLAWVAFAVLAVAALLGFVMFTRWLGAGRHARDAERRFPFLAVGLHGVAGVVTFVLVLLTASVMRGT